ncbi:MAG: ABC transporter substrate-binding protein [Armatimonadota bacterium]|nr:ABC transporter substrate-binding protein [Armatimonadota bacterium]MDR7386217.1 ABC transporter substrate-binding protein [Armatimonadota bacterium]MDR7388465.1 ABC transporter substrate-binding protein [Armatimonadota bacterium]MDR7392777.1 ABC transporter substrate-binding protein [Armatimonadota bacterium]MDR7394860.1 ABC transporter substrate-binding protein [Armatimonadota bacterium]
MRGRRVVAVCAVVLAVGLVASLGGAQQRPLKVAFLSSLSGPFAFWGVNARDGMRMAVAELNEAGGVLGRPVEFVERDDRNNPAEAISAFRFLVEREGISAAGAVISSDVALAASREAETLRVPLFLTMAGSHAILRKTSRFTFRTCLVAAPMYVQAIAAMVQHAKYARVGNLIADYAWGHSIREAVERYVAGLPGVRVQTEVAPVTAADFTPYLRRLQAFDPQLLVIAGHPPGNPVIVRQAAELGMRQQLIGSVLPPELMVQRGGEAVFSRFLDYSCVDFTTPAFRQLAAKYYSLYKRYFDNSAFSGYVIVKMVADAAKKAGSTDPRAVADVIRKGRFVQPGYAFPHSYTEWGELKEARIVFFTIERGEVPGGVCPGCGWAQKYQFRSTLLQPYVPAE